MVGDEAPRANVNTGDGRGPYTVNMSRWQYANHAMYIIQYTMHYTQYIIHDTQYIVIGDVIAKSQYG